MLKVAALALVLIQYTLYNIDNVSTILSISFWKGSGTSWLQVRMKENKKEMEHFYLFLLNRTRATKKKRTLSSIKLPPFFCERVEKVVAGAGREDQLTKPIPLSMVWRKCCAQDRNHGIVSHNISNTAFNSLHLLSWCRFLASFLSLFFFFFKETIQTSILLYYK